MITVVLLLLLPAVLGMSVFRLVQLPRDLLARRTRMNPRRRLLSVFAFIAVYIVLTGHTVLVLIALADLFSSPPQTIEDLLSAASIGAAYPIAYLTFEWVVFYSVKPVVQAISDHFGHA
jgi:hypothetical protein